MTATANPMRLHEVTEAEKADILAFSQKHPWKPAYPASLVNRFLTELTSSNHLIFDLHDGCGRAACGVLIDKVLNPANDACLEVIGVRNGVDVKDVLARFFELCKERTPSSRSGFQAGVADDLPFKRDFFEGFGLKYHYSVYEMENFSIVEKPVGNLGKIKAARRTDAHDVYDILCRAFSKNPDTSIPDAETWNANFLKSPRSHYYLWQGNTAFANLVEPEEGDSTEVRTIGVLPEHRGGGVGRDLLQHCLNESVRLGYVKCQLMVAVENEKALGLYLRSGFSILEKHICYRRDAEKGDKA